MRDVDERERERALRPAPHELPDQPRGPDPGIALCLSGGGYRAMLFHTGALLRLNDAGYLPRLERVSSVSGGSIAAAQLAMAWEDLDFASGVAPHFAEKVVGPLQRLASETIDVPLVLRGLLRRGNVGEKLASSYSKHLFGGRTLQDLPDNPRFVMTAVNLQSAGLWRFSKQYMWDYRVGRVPHPFVPVAVAVAAATAVPPFLGPVVLKLSDADYEPGTGGDLQRPPFTTQVFLIDGGLYDTLGLETAWKRYQTILVSDGGGHVYPREDPPRDWNRQMIRLMAVIDGQIRNVRKRQVIDSYRVGEREGAYWGIRSDLADYGLPDTLPCEAADTAVLAGLPTRLAAIDPLLQERLINWGYAVCDAGLRSQLDPGVLPPGEFPFPAAGVG